MDQLIDWFFFLVGGYGIGRKILTSDEWTPFSRLSGEGENGRWSSWELAIGIVEARAVPRQRMGAQKRIVKCGEVVG
jgi:hypothetical protein